MNRGSGPRDLATNDGPGAAPGRRILRTVEIAALGVMFAGAVGGGICLGLYWAGAARLKAVAEIVVGNEPDPARRFERLTHWVFHNQGFSENGRFFVWPRLRATAVQVLEGGGDCADKSRLLSAMLRQVGVPATMAMCFDPRTGAPVHTVVEAEIGSGQFAVADPVYDLVFPKPDGGHFGLLDLRRDAGILQARLDELIHVRPRNAPVHGYRRDRSVYDLAATFNWQKNAATRIAFDVLFRLIGESVYRLPRPAVLEEPQLSIAAGAFGAAVMGMAAAVGCRRRVRRSARVKRARTEHRCRGEAAVGDWMNVPCGR